VVSTAFIRDFLIGEADIASFSCYSKPPVSAGGAFTLQGWAAYMPVITVNRLDHVEVLQDEINCLFIHPSDTEGLAKQMSQLAKDATLRARLVEGGKTRLLRGSVCARWSLSIRDCIKIF
jgi:glycosyltransferase involved in cell wall biosynthesis